MTEIEASKQKYEQFVDTMCAQAGIADAKSMRENCSLVVNDVTFTLLHADFVHPDMVVLYIDFGKPPAERRDIVLQRILEANLFMYCDSDGPAFSFNAETGHVILMNRLSLDVSTPASVLAMMRQLSDYAKTWRTNFFLGDAERNTARTRGARSAAANTLQKMHAATAGIPAVAGD